MQEIKLPPIWGLPPIPNVSGGEIDMARFVEDSMPIMEIVPAEPTFAVGLHGYHLTSAWKSYSSNMLNNFKIKLESESSKIRVAYLANNPPTETFNNSFGESMLTGFTNATSEGVREAQFFGIDKAAGQALEALSQSDMLGGVPGAGADKVLKGAKWGKAEIDKTMGKLQNGGTVSKMAANMATMGMAVAKGHRLDFPHVWKNSDFNTSYSINVRLYNPSPGNDKITREHIVGPLTGLLMFVVPRSEDGLSYMWPYTCLFRVPGQSPEYAGYIRSISVVKGGDDNVIGYNQVPGVVDVKIDFAILYSNIINITKERTLGKNSNIPTLSQYAESMASNKHTREERFNPTGLASGEKYDGKKIHPDEWYPETGKNQAPMLSVDYDNKQAATLKAKEDKFKNPKTSKQSLLSFIEDVRKYPDRVSEKIRTKENSLFNSYDRVKTRYKSALDF